MLFWVETQTLYLCLPFNDLKLYHISFPYFFTCFLFWLSCLFPYPFLNYMIFSCCLKFLYYYFALLLLLLSLLIIFCSINNSSMTTDLVNNLESDIINLLFTNRIHRTIYEELSFLLIFIFTFHMLMQYKCCARMFTILFYITFTSLSILALLKHVIFEEVKEIYIRCFGRIFCHMKSYNASSSTTDLKLAVIKFDYHRMFDNSPLIKISS